VSHQGERGAGPAEHLVQAGQLLPPESFVGREPAGQFLQGLGLDLVIPVPSVLVLAHQPGVLEDLEVLEGTETTQTLIVSRAITGIGTFT
jgi:hypothetical protein